MLGDATTVLSLLEKNGPTALIACVFAAMWWYERKEVKLLQSKVIKLSAVVLAARKRHEDHYDD